MIKKSIKKVAHKSIRTSKRVISKNPRLKGYAKKVANAYMPRSIIGQDQYTLWVKNNMPDALTLAQLKRQAATFTYNPRISLLTPTYNTNEKFLRECIESVLAQVYENWELCIVDDASTDDTTRSIIKEYASIDPRIKYTFSKTNQHIADASNAAAAMATGEFVAFLDHDDLLWPNALFEVVQALNNNKKLDFIYSDEDKITEDRHHHALPFFKPDWNPEFLRSVNYITHFAVVRKKLFDEIGGFKKEYNGAQDWDLFLRITNKTKNIYHVSTILYSWRISETSTADSTDSKPYVVDAQKNALQDDLKRRGLTGKVRQGAYVADYWVIDYDIIGEPLVSIVIPTKNQYKIMKTCIESILNRTTYGNYEIVIVDTGTTDKKMLRWYDKLQNSNDNIKIVNWHETPFSYVRSCNEGARQAKGEYLVMLNNDTEVLTPLWLEYFLGYAQQDGIGAVGAKLYYPGKKLIQHAGVGVGFGGYAANALAPLPEYEVTPQQSLYMFATHNMSAVTAACLMIKKSTFEQVGGFAEEFRITYNDVDLCLRLLEKGYRNVYLPEVQLVHYESISLGRPEQKKKRDTTEFDKAKALFKKTWQKYITHDPAVNPNISRDNASFDIDTKIKRYG